MLVYDVVIVDVLCDVVEGVVVVIFTVVCVEQDSDDKSASVR